MFDVLPPIDDDNVKLKSSTDQYTGKVLTARKHNYNVPISFDMIDYIDCNGVHSHKAILSTAGGSRYHYLIKKETCFTDQYLTFDHNEVVVKALPHWMGEGMYQEAIKEKAILTDDHQALGIRNKKDLYIGTDYVSCEDKLPVVD